MLVDRTVRDRFVTELQKAIDDFVPDDNLPLVHERRATRVGELIDGAGGHDRPRRQGGSGTPAGTAHGDPGSRTPTPRS